MDFYRSKQPIDFKEKYIECHSTATVLNYRPFESTTKTSMLYDSLKIFHIISATMLLTGIIYSVNLWRTSIDKKIMLEQIQQHTWAVIIPFALLQLATGFTMISLKHYGISDLWVMGSVIGFVVIVMSWFSFLYFLLSAEQTRHQQIIFRYLQIIALSLGGLALLMMIYLMTNKVT